MTPLDRLDFVPAGRLFQTQTRRKPRRCHARTVSGFTMTTIRQSRHMRDNHIEGTRSADVRRTRRGRDRLENMELVSQGEDLEVQPGPRPDRRAQEQRTDYGRSTSSLPVESRNINERSDNGVFSRDRHGARVKREEWLSQRIGRS
jgi:hypothetical protein